MALEPGDRVPTIRLIRDDGQPASLKDYRGQRIILFFYPKALTPGCTTEACDFRDASAALQAAGFTVLGVSPDPPARNHEFRRTHHLPFPLLSDGEHRLAAALGAWGTKSNYGREYEGLIRSTFVIDAEGRIGAAYRNVRAKGHVAKISREILGRPG